MKKEFNMNGALILILFVGTALGQTGFIIPGINSPQTNFSQSNMPQMNVPQRNIPQSNMPQMNVPQQNNPQRNIPQRNIPQPNVPRINFPDMDIPQMNLPQPIVPEKDIPQMDSPQMNRSQPNIPNQRANVPEMTTPQPNIPQPMPPHSIIPHTTSRFGVKYDEALEAIFSIAIRLEALVSELGAKASSNFMVSPLSIAVAIGELMLGASGSLQHHLYDLLVLDSANVTRSESVRHIQDANGTDLLEHHALHEQLGDLMQNLERHGALKRSYMLKTASVLFTQRNLTIKENYKTNIKKYYGTSVWPLDFQNDPIRSEQIVNQWASDQTGGLIRKILPGPVPPQTAAILANAVYFRGDWEIPFSSEVNRNATFRTGPNSTVNVTYMFGEFENYKFVHNKELKCRMVVIPYENQELAMHIVMPDVNNGKEYDINEFTGSLRTKDLLDLIDSAKQRKVFMILPKMALSNSLNVLEPLKRYHQYKNFLESRRGTSNTIDSTTKDQLDALDEKIKAFKDTRLLQSRNPIHLDLSNIFDDANLQISSIYQQMTLSVNEKGTEAAAVAASAIDYILDSVNFRVDRPFLFFIRHIDTEATLFWGTIVDPSEREQ